MGRGEAEGVGELAALLLACISRNAATDIRCEDSELTLSPRGRAGGIGKSGTSAEVGGESTCTCRKDLRLNEASVSSRVGGGGAFDFLRSLAQENSPPDFLIAGGGAMAVLELSCESDLACGALGRERVE